jgi:hypothetical protein
MGIDGLRRLSIGLDGLACLLRMGLVSCGGMDIARSDLARKRRRKHLLLATVSPEVLLPLGLHLTLANAFLGGKGDALSNRGQGTLMPVARLKSGVSLEAANARLAVLSDQLARAYPKENEHQQWVVAPMPRMAITDRPQRDASRLATVGVRLLGMSCVLLLIACLNLANMMLARGAARRKEIAVRLALGAARSRVFRQLLVEALVLSLIGGVFGLLLAGGGARVVLDSLQRLAPVMLVFTSALDPAVLLATFAFCLLATVFFALGPAWRLSGVDVNEDLKEHGGGDAGRGSDAGGGRLDSDSRVSLRGAAFRFGGLRCRTARPAGVVVAGLRDFGRAGRHGSIRWWRCGRIDGVPGLGRVCPDQSTFSPAESAPSTWTVESGRARCMAAATRSGCWRVRQMMVLPLPLSHPPMAPAVSPARITRLSWGMSGSR